MESQRHNVTKDANNSIIALTAMDYQVDWDLAEEAKETEEKDSHSPELQQSCHSIDKARNILKSIEVFGTKYHNQFNRLGFV